MANLFVSLPLPVANGPGASVGTDGMGRDKTIIVTGDFPGATITVEASVDGGVKFAPIAIFQSGSNKKVVPVAAEFMRVNVSGRSTLNPFSASIDVGANDNGALFAALPLPALNGAGASVAASALGSFTTFVVSGSFPGAAILIQASEDGVDWAPCLQFSGSGGIQSKDSVADFYRTFVSGRVAGAPFSATAAVGAINDPVTVGAQSPVTHFDHFEDFINSEGSIQRTLGTAVVTLVSNPSGAGYYIGVIQAQAPAPGDEATVFIQYYVPTNPIAGQQTIDLSGGPFSMEARGNLLHVPDAIDDENITILGVGFGSALAFGVGFGLFGNGNYWAIGAAGPDIDTGVPATTAITKWRIDHDAVTDTATWYIDGLLVATVVGAGVSGVTVGAIVGNISNTTGTCGFLLDYMRIQYDTAR